MGLLDWPGWAWQGWSALSAVGQLLAAVGTIGTLIYLARQLEAQREALAQDIHYRRAEFQQLHSPVVSVHPREVVRTQAHCVTMLRVHAEGTGTAYALNAIWAAEGEESPENSLEMGTLAAGDWRMVELQWPADLGFRSAEPVVLTIRYHNHFSQAISVTYRADLYHDTLVLGATPSYVWPEQWFTPR